MKWLLALLILFILPLVSSLDTYSQNSVVEIEHPVVVDGGIAPTNLNCNITIDFSNGTTLVSFKQMTRSPGGDYYNYTLNSSQTNTRGLYDYTIYCTNGVLNSTQSYSYLINLGGIEPSGERTETLGRSIYIFIILGAFLFISLFFIRSVPIKVTIFMFMIWFILMAVNFSFISLQDEVVNSDIENFMSFFLTISLNINKWILYCLIPFWLIIFFVNILSFKKNKKMERFE